MKITVAVSGGTDSLYALLKLREEGHHVRALHARLMPPSGAPDPVPGLRALCDGFGIELAVADLSEAFERDVVAPFAAEYRRARTPNPCARCNRAIKFGKLLDLGLEGGFGALATGHYAGMAEHPSYGLTLKAGADAGKDQSYFLALTPAERLRRCAFPLASAGKPAVRAWLEERGHVPPLPGESQDICFVPSDDYRSFLESRRVRLPGPGPVILRQRGGERVIAEHKGLWRYTEGQRKGLGIAWSNPLYVLGRDRKRNALVVGTREELDTRACRAEEVNFLAAPALWPERLFVRTRYRQNPLPARVECNGEALLAEFDEGLPPAAPGQVMAVYDEDGFVLAGGVLC